MNARARALLMAGLLLGLAAGSGAGERRALLVGINDYLHGGGELDLRGCVNDVEMVRDALVQSFGFPADNVRVLVDGQATAAAIRRELEEHLIASSGPDDVAYFHYSGHGSRIRDTDGDEEDGWDEIICPADVSILDVRTLLIDDELKLLLDRIRARHVLVVLDACHSGTGTRDLSLCRPRFIDLGRDPGGARSLEPALPAAPAAVGADWSEVVSPARVTLSGCRADQTSADAWIDEGFYAGAFTYNLVRNLRSRSPNASYGEVMERVSRDMAGRYHQVPQLDGESSAGFLGLGGAPAAPPPLSGAWPVAPGMAPVTGASVAPAPAAEGAAAASAAPVEGATAEVPAALAGGAAAPVGIRPYVRVTGVWGAEVGLSGGRAAGLSLGSLYRIYPDDGTAMEGEGLGLVRVASVQVREATAQVLEDRGIAVGARAGQVAHQVDAAGFMVRLDSRDPGLTRALASELESVRFVQVAPPEAHFDARLQGERQAGSVRLVLASDGQAKAEVTAPSPAAAVQAMRPHLANAFLVKQLSELANPAPPFGVRVWANRVTPGDGDLSAALDQAPSQRLVRARVGDVVRFGFAAERDCYLTLVNVGTSGKVTVLFPNEYRPDGYVRGGVVYQTETPGEMPFRIRATGPPGRELVKVIATARPLDLSSLRMGEAADAGTRSISDGVGFAEQLRRDMAAVPAADPGVAQVSRPGLIPTAGWATDYLILDTWE